MPTSLPTSSTTNASTFDHIPEDDNYQVFESKQSAKNVTSSDSNGFLISIDTEAAQTSSTATLSLQIVCSAIAALVMIYDNKSS